MADPKILTGGKTMYQPSSFITIAHDILYAFNAGKGGFLKK